MNLPRWRSSFATLLLLVLVLPIVAACGGQAAVAPTTEPAATAAGGDTTTEATTAATEEAPAATMEEATPEATEAATEEATPEATEEATPEATEAAGTGTEGAAGADEVSPQPDTFRVNFSEPDNIDPQKASFVDEIGFIMLNYQPLMTFDTELKVVPGAAESYELSEDGQTFTFTLRPDQTYSDGEPLTAENFEYAFKRECDPNVAGEYQTIVFPIVGCQEFAEAFTTAGLTVTDEAQLEELREQVGVNALDENTLEVRLKEAAPYFLNVMALWVGAPTRQDLVEAGGENWWSDPANYIGNGPFQLVEWENQSRVLWERNENYAIEDRKPQFQYIEGSMTDESNVVFEAYRAGELDYIGLAAEDLEAVENDEELAAQRADVGGSCTFYLGFNNAVAPFDNKQVRQAFATALDREAWVSDILEGLGTPAYSFIPPGFPGHDPDETRFTFDQEAANELLDASGFDRSQEIKLTYASTARNKARNEYLAAMLQNNLGVTITLDPVDPTVYSSLFKDAETTPPMFILGWCADYPDPQNWTSLVFQTGGLTAGRVRYSSEELDRLTKEADVLPVDDPRRAELHAQAQDILVEDAPVAMFWHNVGPALVKPWITGLNQTPLDYFPGIFDLGSIQIQGE